MRAKVREKRKILAQMKIDNRRSGGIEEHELSCSGFDAVINYILSRRWKGTSEPKVINELCYTNFN